MLRWHKLLQESKNSQTKRPIFVIISPSFFHHGEISCAALAGVSDGAPPFSLCLIARLRARLHIAREQSERAHASSVMVHIPARWMCTSWHPERTCVSHWHADTPLCEVAAGDNEWALHQHVLVCLFLLSSRQIEGTEIRILRVANIFCLSRFRLLNDFKGTRQHLIRV